MADTIAQPQRALIESAAAPPVVSPPPHNPRFPLLDSVRGVAALAVVVTHIGLVSGFNFHTGGWYTARLDVGVTLFFVLSGFLLYRPFVAARLDGREPPRLGAFARRRVLRIVPAYWLALTILTIWPGLNGPVFTEPWRYYLFLQWLEPGTLLSGLGVAWSLCVEVSFYILLPFYAMAVARWLRKRSRERQVAFELGLLTALAVASVAGRQYQHAHQPSSIVQVTLPAFLYWFALGMGLAVLSGWLAHRPYESQPLAVRVITRRPWIPWALAALTFWTMSTRFNLPVGLFAKESGMPWLGAHVFYGLTAFFFVLPAVFGDHAGGWPRRILANRLLAWFGLVSYGIYLWHQPVLGKLAEWGVPAHGTVVLFAATLGLATLCAAGSYYGLERRVLRFKDRRPRAVSPGSTRTEG